MDIDERYDRTFFRAASEERETELLRGNVPCPSLLLPVCNVHTHLQLLELTGIWALPIDPLVPVTNEP